MTRLTAYRPCETRMNTSFSAFEDVHRLGEPLRIRWHASCACLCRASLRAPARGVVASRQTPDPTHHRARPTAVFRL